MLIATSIMFSEDIYEIEKQKKSISTWQKMGARIISCNIKDEIELLSEYFPDIQFVELQRSGQESVGRPLPYIWDILQVLKDNVVSDKESCGIVNSDIFIKNLSGATVENFLERKKNIILILHRYDVISEMDTLGEYYFSGIDAFFFTPNILHIYTDERFMLGAPEWDHWFLYTAVNAGIQVKEIKNKIAFHLKHKQRWTATESNKNAHRNTTSVVRSGEEYYYKTNEIMSDLSNRILLCNNGFLESKEDIISARNMYHDIHRNELIKWEQEHYPGDKPKESTGLIYFKNDKVYRICALHRDATKQLHGKFLLGDMFEGENDKGNLLKYIDFKDLEFVEHLSRVYVYPAGRAAKLLVDCMTTYDIPLLGLIDRDISLQGTTYMEYPILGLDVLTKKDEYNYVIIATNLYVKEIYESLKKKVDPEKLIVL